MSTRTSYVAARGGRVHPASIWRLQPMSPFMEGACWAAVILAVMLSFLVLSLYARSQFEMQEHMNEERRATTAMVCVSGHMSYGKNSLVDRVFKEGRFVCTEWRTTHGTGLDSVDPRNLHGAY